MKTALDNSSLTLNALPSSKLRFGLCCLFLHEPIRFRTTTATALQKLSRAGQLQKLSEICLHNTRNLELALNTAHNLGIGAFRIMSPLLPRMTHPIIGYTLDQLPDGECIRATLESCRMYAHNQQIRLSFHPDQFVVLSSPDAAVVARSVQELAYHGWLAELLDAAVITIHAGGVYGDKQAALKRFGELLPNLPTSVRSRLALENDDISYTPQDLLLFCQRHGIPLVYDVHHHRCNPDVLTVEEATEQSAASWKATGQEPFCHISSPKHGWASGKPKPHADYISLDDFPDCWRDQVLTIDVEAKAKELAVLRLIDQLNV